MYADVVGFGVVEEAHGFDVAEAFEEGLADSVHAVHDTAVAEEDDGKGEVAVADEAGVFGDLAAGDRFCRIAIPVGLVDFADGGERRRALAAEWRRVRRDDGRSRRGGRGAIGGNDIERALFSWVG